MPLTPEELKELQMLETRKLQTHGRSALPVSEPESEEFRMGRRLPPFVRGASKFLEGASLAYTLLFYRQRWKTSCAVGQSNLAKITQRPHLRLMFFLQRCRLLFLAAPAQWFALLSRLQPHCQLK